MDFTRSNLISGIGMDDSYSLIDDFRVNEIVGFSIEDTGISNFDLEIPTTSTQPPPKAAPPIAKTKPRSKVKNPIECNQCHQKLFSEKSYERHQRRHEDDRLFRCSQCDEAFHQAENLRLHRAVHLEPPVRCPRCDLIFNRISSLRGHLVSHFLSELFICRVCERPFATKSTLAAHENKAHADLLEQQSRPVERPKPRKAPRAEVRRPHACSVCSKAFSKPSLLLRHLLVHSKQRPHACTECPKRFAQKATLDLHLRKHAGIRPYACPRCGLRFSQRGNLKMHVRRAHSAFGESRFGCPHCSCVYKDARTLHSHITHHHTGGRRRGAVIGDVFDQLSQLQRRDEKAAVLGEVRPPPEETIVPSAQPPQILVVETPRGQFPYRRTVCSFCAKHFKKPSDLVRHERIHRNVKPFKCLFCDKRFTVKHTLQVHLKIHKRDDALKISQRVDSVEDRREEETNVKIEDLDGMNQETFSPVTSDIETGAALPVPSEQLGQLFACSVCGFMAAQKDILESHACLFEEEPLLPHETPTSPPERETVIRKNQSTTPASLPETLLDSDPVVEQPPTPPLNYIFIFDPAPLATEETAPQPEQQLLDDPATELEDELPGSRLVNPNDLLLPRDCFAQESARAPLQFVRLGDDPVSNISIETRERWEESGEAKGAEAPATADGIECPVCGKLSRKRSDHARHFRTHTNERPFRCPVDGCAKAFKLKCTMQSHHRTHLGAAAKVPCTVCGKAFATRSSLLIHARIHTGALPFRCSFCPLQFRTSGCRAAHENSHRRLAARQGARPDEVLTRRGEMSRMFMAALDDGWPRKETAPEAALQVHVKFQERAAAAPAGKRFVCDVPSCRKAFSKQSLLLRHETVHTRGRSFGCNECGKSFSQKAVLQSHMALHLGVKRFKCDLCDVRFTFKSGLVSHIRTCQRRKEQKRLEEQLSGMF